MNVLFTILYSVMFIAVETEILYEDSEVCDFVKERVIDTVFKVSLR